MNAAGDVATIGLEAARKQASGNSYDWDNKMVVQVTARELPTVLAVLMGYKNACEFRYHGPGRNKGYAIRSQNEGVLITLSAAGAIAINVPVEPSDLFSLTTLVVNRLQMNQKMMSIDALLEILRRSYTDRAVAGKKTSENTNALTAVS